MTRELERRTIAAGAAEIRETSSVRSDRRTLSGFAARFNVDTVVNVRGTTLRERILPGAFAESLRGADQVALWNHNSDFPLGRRSAGSLVLRETPLGLAFALDVPDTALGAMALEAVRRGDVRGMSFGFIVPPGGEVIRSAGGVTVRELVRVNLEEVSPVTFPAYPSTSIGVGDPPITREAKMRRLTLEVAVDGLEARDGVPLRVRMKQLAGLRASL